MHWNHKCYFVCLGDICYCVRSPSLNFIVLCSHGFYLILIVGFSIVSSFTYWFLYSLIFCLLQWCRLILLLARNFLIASYHTSFFHICQCMCRNEAKACFLNKSSQRYGVSPYQITPPNTCEHTRHNPSQTGQYSIYLPWRDGRLSWSRWLVTLYK